MKNILNFEFDDVLIKPIPSAVSSRDDVDISVRLSDTLTLKFPLIASPMVGVVDGKFASQLSKLGGLAILHRFYPTETDFLIDLKNIEDGDNFGISIKVGDFSFKEKLMHNPSILLVDTANGYTDALLEYCNILKNYIAKLGYRTLLMAGNVATYDGCANLYDAGCDIIRVGIGGGSPCSTRNQTGIGVPSLGAIKSCENDRVEGWKVVADGGIKNSGDFVKAIVAGADFCMAGKLFAECFEAPNKGKIYGMASRTHMKNTDTEIKSVEGFDIQITKKHSLEQFVREFGYGIKSAGTYLDANSLEDIYLNGEFIEVTSSAIKKGI